MDWLATIDRVVDHALHNDRFAANVLALGVVLAAVLIVWLILRRLTLLCLSRLGAWTGIEKLTEVGRLCLPRAEELLWWLAVGSTLSAFVAGAVYHVLGGDIQRDLENWFQQLTWEDGLWILLRGVTLGLLTATWRWLIELIRKVPPVGEALARQYLGPPAPERESIVPQWFQLAERSLLITLSIASLLAAGWLTGLGTLTTPPLAFALRVGSILIVARLATLAFKAVTAPCVRYGEKRFERGRAAPYWERLIRLLPLADRCFEMAVYITAGSMCVRELSVIGFAAGYGAKLVQCIGIFFGTRVGIEFLQVLLNEAFGLYSPEPRTSQQARTLVPLLQSFGWYLAHFGGAVAMIKVWEFPTEPILAAAGIVGLAIGLGAQNLVTDLVSGLFILFENQFLVGDFVEIGEARGVVETVAIRHTQIRDEHGKLHIIPNGQIKEVVNYSKGFVQAVVDITLPADFPVDDALALLAEAGKQLRAQHPAVLAETVVEGITSLTALEMTLRAVTRVRPGTHVAVENEFRRLFQIVMQQRQGWAERRAA